MSDPPSVEMVDEKRNVPVIEENDPDKAVISDRLQAYEEATPVPDPAGPMREDNYIVPCTHQSMTSAVSQLVGEIRNDGVVSLYIAQADTNVPSAIVAKTPAGRTRILAFGIMVTYETPDEDLEDLGRRFYLLLEQLVLAGNENGGMVMGHDLPAQMDRAEAAFGHRAPQMSRPTNYIDVTDLASAAAHVGVIGPDVARPPVDVDEVLRKIAGRGLYVNLDKKDDEKVFDFKMSLNVRNYKTLTALVAAPVRAMMTTASHQLHADDVADIVGRDPNEYIRTTINRLTQRALNLPRRRGPSDNETPTSGTTRTGTPAPSLPETSRQTTKVWQYEIRFPGGCIQGQETLSPGPECQPPCREGLTTNR